MSTRIAGTLAPREVADRTGVSPDTLRHYERKRLLPPPARTAAGYRRYAPDTVERVRLIQRALLIGFSLDELAQVLGERARGTPPCRKVRALVAERLDGLEARIEALTILRNDLRVLLAEWDQRLARTPAGTPAHLLETLGRDTSPCVSAARHATGRGAARVTATRPASRIAAGTPPGGLRSR